MLPCKISQSKQPNYDKTNYIPKHVVFYVYFYADPVLREVMGSQVYN